MFFFKSDIHGKRITMCQYEIWTTTDDLALFEPTAFICTSTSFNLTKDNSFTHTN